MNFIQWRVAIYKNIQYYTTFFHLGINDIFTIPGGRKGYYKKINEETCYGKGGRVFFVEDEEMVVEIITI